MDKRNNLVTILDRIERAKKAHHRTDDIKLIVVSKQFSVSDMLDLYGMKIRDFAENYIQAWNSKRVDLPLDIVWHIIGHVQSNKTKWVAKYAAWLQTLDNSTVARKIESQRPDNQPPLNVCIEVNISQAKQKSGILVCQLEDLISDIMPLQKICWRGLMCIPEAYDVVKLVDEMHQMQEIFNHLKKTVATVDTLSMGMSSDLELAIKCGSTMVRVGRALLGNSN